MTLDSAVMTENEANPRLALPREPTVLLALSVPPDWARIDPVREAVQLSVRAAYAPVLIGDRVAIVVSELLENAIKYGLEGPIDVVLEGDVRRLRVSVTNGVRDGCRRTRKLSTHIDWIESFEDPQQAYMACLTMAFQRPDDPSATGSGLGLARIRYEGGCSLGVTTPARGLITVEASQLIDWNAPHSAG